MRVIVYTYNFFFFFYWMTFIILIIPFVTVLMFSTYTNILCNISSLLICNSHYNTIIFTSKMNCLIFFMSYLTQFKLGIFFFRKLSAASRLIAFSTLNGLWCSMYKIVLDLRIAWFTMKYVMLNYITIVCLHYNCFKMYDLVINSRIFIMLIGSG